MNPPRRRRRNTSGVLAGLALVLSVVLVLLLVLAANLPNLLVPELPPVLGSEPTDPTVSTLPTEPPVVIQSTATLAATGDILPHGPVIKAGLTANGTYDFSGIFTYFADYVTAADYAIANLETTLAGLDNGYAYSGYPRFNCPDDMITSLKSAGFDMLLTANNHSYDTGSIGLQRTQLVVAAQGLSHLGTKLDAQLPNYLIANINGIRIGMMCYTYENDPSPTGKAPNSHKMTAADAALINTFDYTNLPLFYEEMTQNIAAMETVGVDAVVMFIHWGDENALTPNQNQRDIAQELCDLGVDVIIGGHPHVIQPVEMLSSTDGTQKTLCIYSIGNGVSNQNRVETGIPKTGHTEDGVLFSVTFTKYSDGTVILTDTDLLPTWVNRHYTAEGKRAYPVLPLDTQIEDWKTQFNLTDDMLKNAQESYDRTMAIVSDGLTQAQEYLAQQKAQTEASLGIQ